MTEPATIDKLSNDMGVVFEGVPVIGLGESWEDGMIALTDDRNEAVKALKAAARDGWCEESIVEDVIQFGAARFVTDSNLFGGDGGWRFADKDDLRGQPISYYEIDLN